MVKTIGFLMEIHLFTTSWTFDKTKENFILFHQIWNMLENWSGLFEKKKNYCILQQEMILFKRFQ
jgi:hypothetical protein